MPCPGYICPLGTIPQLVVAAVRLKQRFCEALEVSHEHRAVTHETGAAGPASFHLLSTPSCSTCEWCRQSSLQHPCHLCLQSWCGREGRSLWCVRRTGVSLGWESDLEWKELFTVLVGEGQVERTLLTPADSLCLRSSEGFQTHPCSLG